MLKDIAGSVYPRWRGEHWQNKHRGTRGAGLSPLARGTLDQAVLFFQRRRFIPAGAGNTQKQNTETAVPAVYPRWRGEHDEITLTTEQKRGLSPLARGTRAAVVPGGRCRRFIPAGAGNTFPRRLQMGHSPVYPRWRGEHSKHNLLLINDFLSQSQSTNFIVSHKQHIHYVKEYLIH